MCFQPIFERLCFSFTLKNVVAATWGVTLIPRLLIKLGLQLCFYTLIQGVNTFLLLFQTWAAKINHHVTLQLQEDHDGPSVKGKYCSFHTHYAVQGSQLAILLTHIQIPRCHWMVILSIPLHTVGNLETKINR